MVSHSCIAVLAAGNLLGSTVKGITGFRSAILNLCVWVVCTSLGIDSGTLEQAVIADCVCGEVIALPLLYVTKALTTCDWRIIVSLTLSGALGAPIGAALLTSLEPRYVEFVMACVLLLVICMQCHVVEVVRSCLTIRWRTNKQYSPCSTSNDDWAGASSAHAKLPSVVELLTGRAGSSMQWAGMGGPPLMLFYTKMAIPKAVVRGSNAVMNALQVRIIAYIILGAFHREDLVLYVVVSAVGVVGMLLGNHLSASIDQRMFSRVLVALMCLCCALLFASAAGVTTK
eukprot:gene5242-5477_t